MSVKPITIKVPVQVAGCDCLTCQKLSIGVTRLCADDIVMASIFACDNLEGCLRAMHMAEKQKEEKGECE